MAHRTGDNRFGYVSTSSGITRRDDGIQCGCRGLWAVPIGRFPVRRIINP